MSYSNHKELTLFYFCLAFIGTSIGFAICFVTEHAQTVKYRQAARILSDVCHMSLDDENLDQSGFEERYYDVLDNLDCYDLAIDKDFVEHLSWGY